MYNNYNVLIVRDIHIDLVEMWDLEKWLKIGWMYLANNQALTIQ